MKTLMISATQSNCGKTSFTLGLVYALRRRGLKVQCFKCGPDYLDPTYLSIASGRTCYNLDLWMGGLEYMRNLFNRACLEDGGVDVAVVEGAMGLYDGIGVEGMPSSAADVARALDLPVVLLCSARSMAGSFAAIIKGFVDFPDAPHISSVVANFVGSDRHRDIISNSVQDVFERRIFAGAIRRDSFAELPSRHLGLVSADENILSDEILFSLAATAEESVDLDFILAGAGEFTPQVENTAAATDTTARLGIAYDDAFHFYYPDNLDALRVSGVELVNFSPLHDKSLPDGLDGLYIGGGYPECFAGELSRNVSMLARMREFCGSGRMVYAECGGLMYLARSICGVDNQTHLLCGVIPVDVRVLDKFKTLGYVEAQACSGSLWGEGASVRGHEYHYSEVVSEQPADWEAAYNSRFARNLSAPAYAEGFVRGNIHASYLHAHFASSPALVNTFVDKLSGRG